MSSIPFGVVIPVTGTNLSFLGQVTRTGERVILARQANSSNVNNISFGDAVTIVPDSTGGTLRQLADAITNFALLFNPDTMFAGIGVREIKTDLTSYPYTPGPGTIGSYLPGQEAEHLVRGSVGVKLNVGTPQANQPVFLRVLLNSAIAAGLVGDLEAAADVALATTGTASAASAALTVASGAGILVGQYVIGFGIPDGTYVAAVTGTAVTLSQNTTSAIAAGTPVTFNFTAPLKQEDVRFKSGIVDANGVVEIVMLRRVAA